MAAAILTLSTDDSLDTIWEELLFTESRLTPRKATKPLAPTFTKLLTRWKKVRDDRYEHWRAELIADAGVDVADEDLDDRVDSVDVELQHAVKGDTSDARYVRYFREPPSTVKRMGLATELKRVDGWPDSLASEPEKALKAQGKALAKDIVAGEAAIEARTTAESERADHFARDLTAFVNDVNAQRESTYAKLIAIGTKLGKKSASAWAGGFFRKSSRPKVTATPATPPATKPS